ncbi:AAA family ATPase [Streptomyces roseochromogenus]|uniref:AAA family ATPase n=1 Tax=Streptomyces roseochromogenus TaxID=285450 RepID=UPI001FD7F3FA|nr:AAA family ATPase [Streptomyces roseochromogenus]
MPTTPPADTIADVNTAERPDCLIVTGMPGAGKSTVTRLIAEQLPRSARLDGDFISRLVVGGRVGALGEPAEEAARQVELCNRNLCTLANNFADAGFTPVIDWVIPDRAQLDFFVSLLPARRVLFVVLAPGSEVCRYRNTIRDPRERFDFDGYDALDAAMRRELGDVGWWFDTAALSPEETVECIVREAGMEAAAGSSRRIAADSEGCDT